MTNVHSLNHNKSIKICDFLMCCLSIWPLFWNLWTVFRFTASISTSIPLYILWAITLFMLIVFKKFNKSFLLLWFVFIGIVFLESIARPRAIIFDLSLILCGVLFCLIMHKQKIDYRLILYCLIACGLFVAICVILDNTLGVFRYSLKGMYTDYIRDVMSRHTNTGGILPHSGSAGCYIFTGLAAYIVLNRLNKRKVMRVNFLVVVSIFVIAAIMIQKRGFILDVIIAIVLIKLLQIKKEDFKSAQFQRQIKRFAFILFYILVFIALYYYVPLIHDSVDSLIGKFLSNDTSLSGRTYLYLLALNLYKGNTLTGIGWGAFRQYSVGIFGNYDYSYEVHNVYLQLLCETGILGLVSFLLAVVSTLLFSIKKYRKIIKINSEESNRYIVEFSIFAQLFFLLYSLSGNPLYDYNFCIMYFVGIIFSFVPQIVEG